MTERELLSRAVKRAGEQPFFLASPLLAYARSEDLSEAALAQRLGCAPADLPAVLLCRRPAGEPPTFRADVQRIADRFRLDPVRLAETIRLAEAVEALQPARTAPDSGLLAAARDRDEQVNQEQTP